MKRGRVVERVVRTSLGGVSFGGSSEGGWVAYAWTWRKGSSSVEVEIMVEGVECCSLEVVE